MTRICALNGRKLILAKTVPCAVESFTAYTCSSYYRRSIRTSLSSLQSHVLTSFWSNSYTPFGRRVERRQVSDDIYIVGQKQPASDLFSRSVAIHTFTHDVTRIWKWSLHFHPSDFVSERMVSNKREKIGSSLFLTYDVNCHLKPIAPFHQSSRRL